MYRDDTVISGGGLWKSIRCNRRALVFAQGFYEWQKKGGEKIPYFVKRTDGKLMCMAGLYDIVQSVFDIYFQKGLTEDNYSFKHASKPLYSFTIITTDNNGQLSFLHDRMPVILDSTADAARWLDTSDHQFSEALVKLLKPFEGKLDCYRALSSSSSFVMTIRSRWKGNRRSYGGRQDQ